MMWKLRRSLYARSDFASRQRTHPRSSGDCAAGFGPTSVIVLDAERRTQAVMSYARRYSRDRHSMPE
jgi:hypothetical protein